MSTRISTVPIPIASPTLTTILVNVKDIKGRQLPNVGVLKRFDRFYVELVIDGQMKYKTATAKGNAAVWTENFYFDALGSSVLECRVYAKHKIGSDDFIGRTKETVESLLAEGAAGVITRELCKDDANGKQCKTQTIIEFTIVAISKASDAAGSLNMDEAVTRGKEALNLMKPPSSSFESIQGVTDATATNVKDNIQSVSNNWDPFLEKVKLFTQLVDTIAEVHPYAKMAWDILSAIHKTILAQVDRDICIVHLVEVMDDVYSFVKEAEPVKKIESHSRIVALMAQQTTECAYFIRDYAMNKNFYQAIRG